MKGKRCFSPILTIFHGAPRIRSFDHITTSGLKSDVIFEFSAPVFTARRYASAVKTVILLAVIVCLSVRPSVRPSVCLSVCHKSELYKDG